MTLESNSSAALGRCTSGCVSRSQDLGGLVVLWAQVKMQWRRRRLIRCHTRGGSQEHVQRCYTVIVCAWVIESTTVCVALQ